MQCDGSGSVTNGDRERKQQMRTLLTIMSIAAFVAASLAANTTSLPGLVDGLSGDYRLSPQSEMVDAGEAFSDLGPMQFEMVLAMEQFLDAMLLLDSDDSVMVRNGCVSLNTLGARVESRTNVLTRGTVVSTMIRSRFHGRSVRCSLWVGSGSPVLGDLPQDYTVAEVRANGVVLWDASVADLRAGGSSLSARVLVDGVPPGAVSGISALQTGIGTELSWNPSDDTAAVWYKAYRVPLSAPWNAEQVWSGSATECTDTGGATVGNRYVVVAYDALGNQSSSEYDIFWLRRSNLVLNTSESGADVADDVVAFPVLVRLDAGSFDFAEAQADGRDIRFARGGRTLAHRIERWDSAAGLAEIWVTVDSIRGRNGTQMITMYWGNPLVGVPPEGRPAFDTAAAHTGTWHLTEHAEGSSGETIYRDASCAGLAASDFTASVMKDGIVGPGQGFDKESGDYLEVTEGAHELSELTMSAWVWLDTIHPVTDTTNPKRENYVYGNWRWWPSSGYQLSLLSDQVVAILNTPGQNWYYREATVTAPRTWFHVAFTWDAGGTLKFYRNGECVSTQSTPVGAILADGATPLRLSHPSTSVGFGGQLDEVRRELTVRSAAWLKLCYENQKADQALVEFADGNTPLAYEGFSYQAGTALHEADGGYGWGGGWQNVRSIEWHKAIVETPGATAGQLSVTGGKGVVDNTTAHVYRPLPRHLGGVPGDTVWMSFIIGDTDDGTQGAWNAFAPICGTYGYNAEPWHFDNRLFGLQIDGEGTGRAMRIKKHWANDTWTSPEMDHYGWGSVPWTPADHFVIVRLVIGSQNSNVCAWVDPPDPRCLGSAHLGLDGNNNGPVAFDGVLWFAEPVHADRTAVLDEVRIGTTLESVTPGY
ncbi:MAG: DUF2341 domain-containing protein [Chitinivibrionales bacterium]|nr:DUF2341 domain-containing protein [Chitinivibrionales bacterium]